MWKVMDEFLYDFLDAPRPLGVSPITAAWEIYNPVLAANFSNQRKLLSDRYLIKYI